MKKKENKNFDKIKELEIELVKIKYVNNRDKLPSALKELNKVRIVYKDLHEIENEISVDYTGEFEMVVDLKVLIKFVILILDLEILMIMNLIITLLMKDMLRKLPFSRAIFIKINALHFNLVSSSQYGDDCVFKHELIECSENNCFVSTKAFRFVKCIN